MTKTAIGAIAAACVLAIGAAPAVATEVTLSLDAADVERNAVAYRCTGAPAMTVEYVNAGDNALALVPIDGRPLVFVTVLSGSGARYASGPYIWWTKGREASLFDQRNGEDAAPTATCEEK